MFRIVLFQPEIPPNTGNIMRLCANMGAELHLIQPYGFNIDEKKLRRAGLDYRDWVVLREHESFDDFFIAENPSRLIACSTRGQKSHVDIQYADDDFLLFGPETRGLPQTVLEELGWENVIRIPMVVDSRSLNLSNAVAIIAFEAWRQLNFVGADLR